MLQPSHKLYSLCIYEPKRGEVQIKYTMFHFILLYFLLYLAHGKTTTWINFDLYQNDTKGKIMLSTCQL